MFSHRFSNHSLSSLWPASQSIVFSQWIITHLAVFQSKQNVWPRILLEVLPNVKMSSRKGCNCSLLSGACIRCRTISKPGQSLPKSVELLPPFPLFCLVWIEPETMQIRAVFFWVPVDFSKKLPRKTSVISDVWKEEYMELINVYYLYPVGLLSLGGMNFVPHIRDGFVWYKVWHIRFSKFVEWVKKNYRGRILISNLLIKCFMVSSYIIVYFFKLFWNSLFKYLSIDLKNKYFGFVWM